MDTLLLIARSSLALVAVLALIFILRKRIARAGMSGPGQPITLVARQGLTQKSAVVVMDTGGKRYVLGVTEANVSVLGVDAAPEPDPVEASSSVERTPAAASWSEATKGSILSPATWNQAKAAIASRRK